MSRDRLDSTAGKARLRWVTFSLHLGFALTGVGTVLLGCILPRLSAEAHLKDKDAGLLLLAQFAAAGAGALLVRRNFWKSLAWGYVLISASGFGIALLRSQILLSAFALLGLGFGLAMTSTSMLIGRLYSERKGSALAILNFFWSAGAVGGPLLVTRFLTDGGSSIAFAPLALLAAPFAFLPLLANNHSHGAEKQSHHPTRSGERKAIAYFSLLSFLYVGIEATVGNWMSTYATRDISWSFRHSTWAVSCFWAALLLGRAITPAILLVSPESRLYKVSVFAVGIGIALILLAHSPGILLAGAAFTGLALAPLFPLILSLFMAEVGESRHVGWVFAIAGFGGATLSGLTGIVSTDARSLRIGLLVPAAAVLILAFMILAYGRTPERDPLSSAEQDILLPPT